MTTETTPRHEKDRTMIEFRDPPASNQGGGGEWAAIAEQLRARPGEWAFLGCYLNAIATYIKNGRIKAFRDGTFEAITRNNKGSRADIYARYVGE